ncbi:hypothetical protein SUGI_0894120 [Cryptomeria japonica]|nr:hypothetical protein SUGI_0894120 [Cryptomeria japonica]
MQQRGISGDAAMGSSRGTTTLNPHNRSGCYGCHVQASYVVELLPFVAIANASSLEDGSLQTYIVYTSDSQMPSSFGNPERWYSSLVDSFHGLAEDQDGSQSILYNYNQVFHGFATNLTRAQAKALEKIRWDFSDESRDDIPASSTME